MFLGKVHGYTKSLESIPVTIDAFSGYEETVSANSPSREPHRGLHARKGAIGQTVQPSAECSLMLKHGIKRYWENASKLEGRKVPHIFLSSLPQGARQLRGVSKNDSPGDCDPVPDIMRSRLRLGPVS